MFFHLPSMLNVSATLLRRREKIVQIYHGIQHKMRPQDFLQRKHWELFVSLFLHLPQPAGFQTSFLLKIKNYMPTS